MTTFFLFCKAIHLIAVICWFAGLFYLPRLFVYHSSSEDKVSRARFELMEAKLFRIIMSPSMMVAVVFGLLMIGLRFDAYAAAGWLWLKLVLVAGLIGFHIYCKRIMVALASDSFERSENFLRMLNEVPVLPLVIIVFLAVFKPFA